MATKTITGSYPTGYDLKPAYDTLVIAATASVGGTGVTTTDTQPSTINNLGQAQGTGNGILLSDGGAITNGATTNSAALIEGTSPIVANNAPATVKNYAMIKSDPDANGNIGPGVFLHQGGSVANFATGQITNGVYVFAAPGKVTNDGTIGGVYYGRYVNNGSYGYRNFTSERDFRNAVLLKGGGTVTNGTAGNASAKINNGITISGGLGTVMNNGVVTGPTTSYFAYYSGPAFAFSESSSDSTGPSISLTSGGTVTNGSNSNHAASIANGIAISGAAGKVTNSGTIGASTSGSSYDAHIPFQGDESFRSSGNGYAITFDHGGSITNGSATNTAATIDGGIKVTGGSGTIVNQAVISGGARSYSDDSTIVFGTYQSSSIGYSIRLQAGGTITNGSSTNTAAKIGNGIGVFGGAGTIVNQGTISGAPQTYEHNTYGYGPPHVEATTGYSIALHSGGSVTNGAASNTAAAITGGIDVQGATASVVNYGTIQNNSAHSAAVGIKLEAGGTIVNGGSTDASASISGKTGIVASGAATVTNFGTIQGTTGLALSFDSPSGRLIEEGTGVLAGAVAGGGGTLELAGKGGPGTLIGLGGTIAGFATVTVDKGATWSLSGPSTLAKSTVLNNAGTLTLVGQVVNSGKITNLAGATLAFAGDVSITTDPAVKAGQFSNAGLVEKTGGTGISIIRTGTASLVDTGTIDVDSGTLELTGQTITVAGLIQGAGTIEFGPGSTSLTRLDKGASIKTAGWMIAGSGAHVTVARNLGYAGSFTAGANTELTIEGGDTLQLTGPASFTRDTVDGAGRITTTGATTLSLVLYGGTGQWRNTGTVTETGQLTLGDVNGQGAVFVNQAGGVFNLAGNVGIDGTAATATFTNQGLLAKTAGGMSSIAVALANSGIVEAASGTLDLQGAVSGTGMLKIDAGKVLQADAAVAGTQTVDFNGGNDRLVLTDAAHFAGKLQDFGSGDRLDLRQFNPGTTTLAFSEKADNSGGTLTVSDGTLTAKIALLGQYAASGFHTASDGVGGTYVTYTPPAASALAIPHS